MDHDWIPALYWFDSADMRQFREGIHYVSRTSLSAPNSRLKLVEPFEVSIPEHPPTDGSLLASSKQKLERSIWPGGAPDAKERVATLTQSMPLLLRVPKETWMDPAFEDNVRLYVPKQLFDGTDFAGLREYLSALEVGGGTIGLILNEQASPEIAYTTWMFTKGKRRSIGTISDLGLPDRDAPGFGLLLTTEAAEEQVGNPFYPDLLDELIPLHCVDGNIEADIENPGLIYKYARNEHCWKSQDFSAFKPLGASIEWDLEEYPREFFDADTGDLWLVFPSL